jgi:hypothetical protein
MDWVNIFCNVIRNSREIFVKGFSNNKRICDKFIVIKK